MRLIDADELIEKFKEDRVFRDSLHEYQHYLHIVENEPTISAVRFNVRDPQTGNYPDLEKIALTEEWAKDLMYCDMDGFIIDEDGQLILMDDCGNFRYCPEGRFITEFEGI